MSWRLVGQAMLVRWEEDQAEQPIRGGDWVPGGGGRTTPFAFRLKSIFRASSHLVFRSYIT